MKSTLKSDTEVRVEDKTLWLLLFSVTPILDTAGGKGERYIKLDHVLFNIEMDDSLLNCYHVMKTLGQFFVKTRVTN